MSLCILCIETGDRVLVVKRVWTGGDESFIDAVSWVNLRRRWGKKWLLPAATVDSLKLNAHRTRVRTSEGVARTVRSHVVRVVNLGDESVGLVAEVSWSPVSLGGCRNGGDCEKEQDEEERGQDRTVQMSYRHCLLPPKRERSFLGSFKLERERGK